MNRIFKYNLITGQRRQVMALAAGSRLLSAVEQHGRAVIYASVPDVPSTEHIDVWVYMTGEDLQHDLSTLRHLGTIGLQGGLLMLHVFTEQL
jgi:hypothetical protein